MSEVAGTYKGRKKSEEQRGRYKSAICRSADAVTRCELTLYAEFVFGFQGNFNRIAMPAFNVFTRAESIKLHSREEMSTIINIPVVCVAQGLS